MPDLIGHPPAGKRQPRRPPRIKPVLSLSKGPE